METKQLEDFRKAGRIAAKAREIIPGLIKPGTLYVEIADKVEQRIVEFGGKPGFPCNISINDVAAHHVPLHGEILALKEGDLVKVDFGAHVNGAVADMAVSFSVGKNELNEKLIEASEAALTAAIAKVRPGITVSEVGTAIEKEITSRGFLPIKNLCGHLVEVYNLHAGISIPNYNTKAHTKLEEGMAIAIEPFATNGNGLVSEGAEIGVYRLENGGAVRIGKEILDFIISEYQTLPFAKRWLIKKFNPLKVNLFLKEAVAKGILYEYNVLLEKKGSKVAQSEHTILVKEKPEILTA